MNRCTTTTIVMLLATTGALAQIGMDEAACTEAWGTIQSGQLDAEGNGTLLYNSREVSVELVFSAGCVQQATYAKPGLDNRDVDSLLKFNNAELEWNAWTPPGVPTEDIAVNMWLRSDDLAMAELKEDMLHIVGGNGNPSPAQQAAAPAGTPSPSSDEATAPGAEPQPPIEHQTPVIQTEPPARPTELPKVGAIKPDVLHLLGEPSGTMQSGSKQILVYEWGNIWIEQGKVIHID